MRKLAIIGGGPSAACIIDALARNPAFRGAAHVTVFEPSQRLWHGQAFQPDGDEVLANVSMAAMSIRANDREHGIRWLKANNQHAYASEGTFPPRWLVGQYLRESVEEAVGHLESSGSRVQVKPLTAHSLVTCGDELWVRAEGGNYGPFDQVVLCPSAPASYDPYNLTGLPGYIQTPYPLRSALVNIPRDSRVAIIGSGLTAVDTAMALRARDHRGKISMVSRSGLLPSVRSFSVKHESRYLTVPRLEAMADENGKLRLTDLLDLTAAELGAIGVDMKSLAADLINGMSAPARLRADLERARIGDPGWTVLRQALVNCWQDAWYMLRDEDKATVRCRHQTLMRLASPMPAKTAERLLKMFETGQLELVSEVTSIYPSGTESAFHIQASRNLMADVVIAASTPAMREPSPMTHPLITSLFVEGLATAHAFGGLQIDRKTSRLLNLEGSADPRLHALGDLTNGAYLFTFGMPVLAERAECIIADIASNKMTPVRN